MDEKNKHTGAAGAASWLVHEKKKGFTSSLNSTSIPILHPHIHRLDSERRQKHPSPWEVVKARVVRAPVRAIGSRLSIAQGQLRPTAELELLHVPIGFCP